jgi:hypothetical protein
MTQYESQSSISNSICRFVYNLVAQKGCLFFSPQHTWISGQEFDKHVGTETKIAQFPQPHSHYQHQPHTPSKAFPVNHMTGLATPHDLFTLTALPNTSLLEAAYLPDWIRWRVWELKLIFGIISISIEYTNKTKQTNIIDSVDVSGRVAPLERWEISGDDIYIDPCTKAQKRPTWLTSNLRVLVVSRQWPKLHAHPQGRHQAPLNLHLCTLFTTSIGLSR